MDNFWESSSDSEFFILEVSKRCCGHCSHWLRSLEHETHERCSHCFSAMMQPISFRSVPNVLVFEINSRNIKLSKTLKFEQQDETVTMGVRGLICHGDFHFISR